jgi:hypothetical protein
MLVEDLLHERYDEHPENATEGNCKDCTRSRKPYLVIIDIGGFIEVEVLLVRLSTFVMATVVMVTFLVIMVAFFFIVAMVRMSIGFGCKHLGSPAGPVPPHLMLLPVLMLFSGGKHSHAQEAHMRESQLHFCQF